MSERVCPFWLGYLLANPLRRLVHDPGRIAGPYVKAGMTVLDVGCAMGFFTLPLARMVGPSGSVIGVDVQDKMLGVLRRRAARAGLSERIVARLCGPTSLGLDDHVARVDFALAFAVVHEAPDAAALFAEIRRAMKVGAGFVIAEPRGHVSAKGFETTLALARDKGLDLVGRLDIPWSRAALLKKR